MIRIDDILDEVSKHTSNPDLDFIRRAYSFSAKAHADHECRNGGPCLTNAIEVAHILATMCLNEEIVSAGLLYKALEDNPVVLLDQVRNGFGEDLAGVVEGAMKIGQLRSTGRDRQQAENFKKMLIATSKDSRAVDQGRQVRPELDAAFLQAICFEPGAAGPFRAGLQPGKLFASIGAAIQDQALVPSEPTGETDQDWREGRDTQPLHDLPDGRGGSLQGCLRGNSGADQPTTMLHGVVSSGL